MIFGGAEGPATAGIDDAVAVDFGFDDGDIGRETIGAITVVDNVATLDPPPTSLPVGRAGDVIVALLSLPLILLRPSCHALAFANASALSSVLVFFVADTAAVGAGVVLLFFFAAAGLAAVVIVDAPLQVLSCLMAAL